MLAERPPRAHLLSCVLEAVAEGDPRPELVPDLVAFLTDAALPAGQRADAVPALVRACRDDAGAAVDLFHALLGDPALDPDADLAGALLLGLYPAHLGRADLVAFLDRYLGSTGRQRGGDRLHLEYTLSRLVPVGEEAFVLDALAAKCSPARRPVEPLSRSATVGKVALDLLARAIPGVGAQDAPRVAGWIGALNGVGDREASTDELKAALASRPDLFVPMLIAVAEQADDGLGPSGVFSAAWRLRRALPCWPWPADAAHRLMAAALAEEHQARAMALLAAAHSVGFWAEPFDQALFEVLAAAAKVRAAFAYVHDSFCAPTPPTEWKWRIEAAFRKRKNKEAERKGRSKSDRALRGAIDRIQAGTALGALHWLGKAWFGLIGGRQSKEGAPADRLRAVVDQDVASAAEGGMRKLAARGDVPLPADLARQAVDNRFYVSSYSFLAGADLLFADAGGGLPQLPPERLASLLCLALVTQTVTKVGDVSRADERPWMGLVAPALPDEAARAVRALVVPQLEAGAQYVSGLRQLCEEEAFAPVRARLLPDLLGLASSPHAFDLLSRAALRELPPAAVLEAARRRLDRDDAGPVAERWPWLVLAWRLDPAAHAAGVRAAVEEDPALLKRLARATGETTGWGGPGAPWSGPPLTLAHRELVLRLTGPSWPPAPAPEGAWSPPVAHDLGHFVFGQLDRLAAIPGPEAEALLVEISDDPAFAAHRDAARHVLAVRRREERRRAWEAPGVSAAARALRSGPPASGPDLLAFAEAHLRDIGASLRATQDNQWRGFWNTDQNGRPTDAKVENVCRDHVVMLLRSKLQAAGVSADTEVRFPVDDRCDIVAHALGRTLPVEVKCDWHRELWSAWRDQLAARYAAEPRAAGLGIYLVLWFGDMRRRARKVHAPPGGDDRPARAPDLERRLQEAMRLEGLAVRAVVLDASPPPSAATGGKPRAGRRVGRPR